LTRIQTINFAESEPKENDKLWGHSEANIAIALLFCHRRVKVREIFFDFLASKLKGGVLVVQNLYRTALETWIASHMSTDTRLMDFKFILVLS